MVHVQSCCSKFMLDLVLYFYSLAFTVLLQFFRKMSNAKSRDKTTYFNDQWLKNPSYSLWLKRVNDNTRYGCKVCPEKKNSPRTLGDMGEDALTKHAKTEMHKKNLNQFLETKRFLLPRLSAAPVPAKMEASDQPPDVVVVSPSDEPGLLIALVNPFLLTRPFPL